MVAMIVGIALIVFAVFACFPPLSWGADIIVFLKGAVPVFSVFVGLIAVFIGIADMKDRVEAKKEEEEEKKSEAEGKKDGGSK